MRPPAIRCFGLSKRFTESFSVQNVDLAIDHGEKMVLIGPSGCGKTTLLRLIAGFETPTSGTLAVGGELVTGPEESLPPEKRRVGMVFQDYALFPHMDVEHNVAFGIRDKSIRSKRVAEVLSMVGLTGMGKRYPHALSGGEQQRVALARALAPRPAIVLLDEPFSNLDAGLRGRVRRDVLDILNEAETSAIFVTHDQEEAMLFGDRIAVMNEGQIEQVDTPEIIFHNPSSIFVAKFMGIADFIPAWTEGNKLVTEIGALKQPHNVTGNKSIELMVRPDDVSITEDQAGKCRILERVFQGAHNLYKVALPSGNIVHSIELHYRTYAVGQTVSLRIDAGHPLTCAIEGNLVAIPNGTSES
jgi:iron(III) transport system ATP-binding protein